MIRLRAQVREIEIQAESQIQSRLMQVGEGAGGLRSARIRPLYALPGARALAGRRRQRRVDGPAVAAEEPRRRRRRADRAGAGLSRDVQQQLFAIRTVPFGSLSERLYRILRGTARELDKRANLEIRGAQTELDRSVLEKLVGPLEHLLRNALDHGIEPRAAARRGRQVGDRRDHADRAPGRQRNRDRARRRRRRPQSRRRSARRRSRRDAIDADAQPTDAQLIECIFEPGFTTASSVTQVSGRGIGMDVVRSEIAALGGRVEVSDAVRAAARRSSSTCRSRLRVAQAVLGARRRQAVGAAGADGRAGAARSRPDVLVNMYVAAARSNGRAMSYPFHYLPRLLGDPHQIPESHALQSGAAAAQRPERRGHPRRRNDRQPGSRREEHRAAARARVRNRGRHGAGQRRDRPHHQSRAARAALRRAGVRPERRARWRRKLPKMAVVAAPGSRW